MWGIDATAANDEEGVAPLGELRAADADLTRDEIEILAAEQSKHRLRLLLR